ncbi:MAG: hypothetical protein NT075_28680 [Chloroflexi bacterium]|nr:hypothetical protein [Chloroflexota bacterium]
MTLPYAYRILVPLLMFVLVACNPLGRVEPTIAPTMMPTLAPTTEPMPEAPTPEITSEPTAAPSAAAPQLSFTPKTYTDERAGFELDYPAEWTLDPSSQVGVRGGQALLLSPGTTPETLANGGTRVSITTYNWDPKNDLAAYVAQRKVAWDASGFAIIREERWPLADGRVANIFVVKTPEQPTFTLLTTIGQDYLQISGDGDSALVEEIAHTLRPLQ